MHYAVSRVMGRGNHGEKRPLSLAEAEDNDGGGAYERL